MFKVVHSPLSLNFETKQSFMFWKWANFIVIMFGCLKENENENESESSFYIYIYIYILGGSELNLVTINLQLWVVKGETVQIWD